MPPTGFEPAIQTSERPQTHPLDSAATSIGRNELLVVHQTVATRPRHFVGYTATPADNYRGRQAVQLSNKYEVPEANYRFAPLSISHQPEHTVTNSFRVSWRLEHSCQLYRKSQTGAFCIPGVSKTFIQRDTPGNWNNTTRSARHNLYSVIIYTLHVSINRSSISCTIQKLKIQRKNCLKVLWYFTSNAICIKYKTYVTIGFCNLGVSLAMSSVTRNPNAKIF
jgi:hypothetical protein